MKPRQYSKKEVKEKFIKHIHSLVEYWENVDDRPSYDKLNGLAFSILAAIDGGNCDLPAFILAPMPHKDDKEFHISEGENYYPYNDSSKVKCDIGGGLHEIFGSTKRKKKSIDKKPNLDQYKDENSIIFWALIDKYPNFERERKVLKSLDLGVEKTNKALMKINRIEKKFYKVLEKYAKMLNIELPARKEK